ncbi:MAG: hypothetical protein Q8L68_06735, partial [Methylococcales bacterium]|nr:hypothetical protein [Methylococcales bacterium]
MKLLTFGLVFLSLALTTQSQTTFFKWIPSPFHEFVSESVQTSNHEFILVGEKGNNADTVHGYCVKINNNGDVVQTLELNSGTRVSRLTTINPYPGYEHRFIVTGYNDSINTIQYKSSLMLMVMNDSLQVIRSKEIEMDPGRMVIPWKVIVVEDSIIYLLAHYDTIPKFIDLIVFKLNMQFSLLNRFHPSDLPYCGAQDIFFNQSNETLYIYYFGQVINDLPSSNNVVCLDRNLAYKYGAPVERLITTNISASPLNDSVFFVTGSAISTHTTEDKSIGIYLVNDSNRTLKASEFWDSIDTLLWTSRGGHTLSIDRTNSCVYLAGIFNFEPWGFFFQTKPTWVQFVQTDFDLNIKAHTLYGGDAAYLPWCNISVKEGGSLIAGGRFNYLNPDDKRHNIFLLKTDT